MAEQEADGLRIAQVEQLTGVGAHTLRAWERRYGVPVPDRTGGRQRMYSTADVQMVRRMRELSMRGVPLAKAAETVLGGQSGQVYANAGMTQALASNLVEALLGWDEAEASRLWVEALDSLDLLSAFERVIVPAMKEVGTAWHEGVATVAQEHFATNFVRARLDLLSRQVQPLPGAPAVLLACLEGEHHELGLLMLAVTLRFQGVRTIYLGQDVPTEDLLRTAEDSQPDVVAVNAGSPAGAALVPGLATRLAAAAPLTTLVFGGYAFDSDPALREVPGARYGGPDLRSAASLIISLGRMGRAGGKS